MWNVEYSIEEMIEDDTTHVWYEYSHSYLEYTVDSNYLIYFFTFDGKLVVMVLARVLQGTRLVS